MAISRKKMWDTLDEIEGKKYSSYKKLQEEMVRQRYKKRKPKK